MARLHVSRGSLNPSGHDDLGHYGFVSRHKLSMKSPFGTMTRGHLRNPGTSLQSAGVLARRPFRKLALAVLANRLSWNTLNIL